MKKLIVLALLLCATTTYAQCITSQATIAYYDPVRFMAVDRIAGASQEQGFMMIQNDILDGRAVVLKPGTKVDFVNKYNNYIIFCDIDGYRVVILSAHVRCK